MNDVAAVELYTWLLSYCCCIADRAEVFTAHVGSLAWFHLFDALRFKTRHALSFSCNTFARMSTWQHFVTRFLHKTKAIWLSADVTESWFHARRWLFQFISAESARGCNVLIASLAHMIRLYFAFCAKILAARITPDSVLGHVLRRLHRNRLTLIILLPHDDLARNHLHHVSARAADHVGIILDQVHHLSFIDFLLVFFAHELLALVLQYLLMAPRALDRLVVGEALDDLLPEAVHVDLVEAVCGL